MCLKFSIADMEWGHILNDVKVWAESHEKCSLVQLREWQINDNINSTTMHQTPLIFMIHILWFRFFCFI
jgi:hypothetical protein